jgi:hypothetical protein
MWIESVGRRSERPFLNASQARVIFYHSPGMSPVRTCHEGGEEAAVFERSELVGDGGIRRVVGVKEGRVARVGNVEEEDLIVPIEDAEETPEGQCLPVAGEAHVVGFVTYGARPG